MTTLRRARVLTPRMHLPLRRLALCLDCDECFEIGFDACPGCGSETWTALARFLETASARQLARMLDAPARPSARAGEDSPRHLLIVSRDRPGLFRHLHRAFEGNHTIKVVTDRRQGERRRGKAAAGAERRRGDRRRQSIEDQLRAVGWSVVLVNLARAALPAAR